MKIIDGKGARMGRLASYVAKELLKGEEINIVNCNEVLITGNKKDIKGKFKIKRSRFGSSQKGPKISRRSDLIVKRAIRGMLPQHRNKRGKESFRKVKCYVGVPEEFKEKEKIKLKFEKPIKSIKVQELKNGS
ncbi:50S ribosomal protein L13 [Candidatus Pacearchaeota archaeon]|nr:50S ribosomal protein L13 [Candidatus Pacearchaeota archaeon]